jgi:Flp pilus assembly protein TadD
MGPIQCCTVLALIASMAAFGQTTDRSAFLGSGIYAFRAGEFSMAAEYFQRVIEYEPANAAAFLYPGTAYAADYDIERHDGENFATARKAELAFRKALELSPDNKLGLASLDVLLYYMGDQDETSAGGRRVAEAKLQPERLETIDPPRQDRQGSGRLPQPALPHDRLFSCRQGER